MKNIPRHFVLPTYYAEGLDAHNAGFPMNDCPEYDDPGKVFSWQEGWKKGKVIALDVRRTYSNPSSLN